MEIKNSLEGLVTVAKDIKEENKMIRDIQGEKTRKEYIRKDVVLVTKLNVGFGSVNGDISLMRQESSRLLEVVPQIPVTLSRGASLKEVSFKFAKKVLVVSFGSAEQHKVNSLVDNGIWIEFNPDGFTPIGAFVEIRGLYYRVAGNKKQPNVDRIVHYSLLGHTAGSIKIKKGIFYAGTDAEMDEVIRTSTCGAYDAAKVDPDNRGQSAKAIARLFLTVSPSKLIANDAVLTYFDKPFPSAYSDGLDGMGFVNRDFGFSTAQYRTEGFMSKVFGLAVRGRMIVAIMERLKKSGHLYLPEGYSFEDVDILLDSNGVKLHNVHLDKSTGTYKNFPINLRILDMPNVSPISTSVQMLEKAIAADPVEGLKLTNELLKEGLNKELTYRLEKKGNPLKLGESNKLFEDGFDVATQLLSMSPQAMLYDKGLAHTVIEQTMDGSKKIVTKMKVKINESLYARGASDIAFMLLGEEVIKFGEFYSNIVCEKAVFFKYPSMGASEVYKAVNVKGDTVESRIADIVKRDPSKALNAEIFLEFLDELENSVTLFPNSGVFRKLLAGSDFDFDGFAMVYDKRFINILKGKKPFVVNIEIGSNSKSSLAEVQSRGYTVPKRLLPSTPSLVTSHIRREAFKTQMSSKGKSIGQITNLNSTNVEMQLTLIYGMLTGDKKRVALLTRQLKEVIVKALKIDVLGKGTYEPMPVHEIAENSIVMDMITVNDDFEAEFVRRVKSSDLDSPLNLIAILKDDNVLRRRHQEMTIDTDKTGIAVAILFWIEKYKTKTLVKPEYTIDNTGLPVFTRGYVKPGVTIVEGVFSDIQDKLMEDTNVFSEAVLQKLYEKAGFDSKQLKEINNMITLYPREKNALVMLKQVYSDYNKILMSNIYNVVEKETSEEYGLKLAEVHSFLGGLVNATVQHLDTDVASSLVLGASSWSRDMLNNGRNRFAMKTVPELYFHYMINTVPGASVESERFYGDIEDRDIGVVAYLVDGKVNEMHAHGYTKTEFTGEVTIVDINGKLFATREIVVPRQEMDKMPVVMKKVIAPVAKNDHVIFLEESIGGYSEHRAYKILIAEGRIVDKKLIGTYDGRSLVNTFSPTSPSVYTVKGTYSDSVSTVSESVQKKYSLNCLFVG